MFFVEFSVCVFRLTWCTHPPLRGDVPMEHRQALEQKGRENGQHTRPTNDISITD